MGGWVMMSPGRVLNGSLLFLSFFNSSFTGWGVERVITAEY